MPFFAIAAIGSSLIGGIAGAVSSSNAASAQEQAANTASQTQLQMFDQTQANEQPFIQAGANALPALQAGLGLGPGGGGIGTGSLNKPFSAADFQSSPGYQFQMQQGEQAVTDQASATGGVGGGNTLKALTTFGQGVANQDYWNAYNAYVGQQNQQYGQLSSLVGTGQASAGSLAQASGNASSGIASTQLAAGQAQAAGALGVGNAITGTANSLQNAYLLNNLTGGGGGFDNIAGGGDF